MELKKNFDLKDSDEFRQNLDMIVSQIIVDRDLAEKKLLENENDLIKTMTDLLNYKPPDIIIENDIHKQKIKELRYIMKEKDKFFNKNVKKD